MFLKFLFTCAITLCCLKTHAVSFGPFQSATEARQFLADSLTDSCIQSTREKQPNTDSLIQDICRCTATKLSNSFSDSDLNHIMTEAIKNENQTVTLEQFFKENSDFQDKLFQSGALCIQPQIEKVFTSFCQKLPQQKEQASCICFAQTLLSGLSTDELVHFLKIWALPRQQAIVLMTQELQQPHIGRLIQEAQENCLPPISSDQP